MAPCLLRDESGRAYVRSLPAWRHARIHLKILHARTPGLVELAVGRRNARGKLRMWKRSDENRYFPGGAAGDPAWLDPILAAAATHRAGGREVFISVAERTCASALSWHTPLTRHLWLDVDDAAQLPVVYRFLKQGTAGLPGGRRPSLIVHSGRGAHFYFPLAEPLPALIAHTPDGRVIVNPTMTAMRDGCPEGFADPITGELLDPKSRLTEPIEEALLRLAHAIGHRVNEHGRQVPTIADEVVAKRSQPMRLAGTFNHRRGELARVLFADATVGGYHLDALVGDLPDPPDREHRRSIRSAVSEGDRYTGPDPFKHLDLRQVYSDFTGRQVPADGRVSCPAADHEDKDPSCSVRYSWFKCWSCPARGDIYQFVSALTGGPPYGHLRDETFLAALQALIDRYGDLRQPPGSRAPIPSAPDLPRHGSAKKGLGRTAAHQHAELAPTSSARPAVTPPPPAAR